MQKTTFSAESLYPDNVDVQEYQGVAVRKGTMAAIIANIDVLEARDSSEQEKSAALEQIRQYMPAVIATGLYQKVIWKNKLVQGVMQDIMEYYNLKD
ncbi:MAG TPA: hypothetical protein VHE99_10605 [Gammaproteobacteria bacterium]|nr:hypothetical protein [Gammaproteobacteria bacterium]